MTLFEYLSVAISVVLSLSAAQLLLGIRFVFDRDRLYWVHAVWVIHLLLIHVLIWWNLWSYRDIEWNIAAFALVLFSPAVLFVASTSLVPPGADSIISWRDHFFKVRPWFFGARAGLTVLAVIRTSILLDAPLSESLLPARVSALIVCVLGITSQNRTLHAVISVYALLVLTANALFTRFLPGRMWW